MASRPTRPDPPGDPAACRPAKSAVLLDPRRLAWTHGAAAKSLVIEGDAAPVIVTVAAELGADLLVIGNRPHPLPSALTARTGWWVRAHAPCPVLPVSGELPRPPRPAAEPVLVT